MYTLKNVYLPKQVRIRDIIDETPDVKTFVLDLKMDYTPGQFVEISVFGVGEMPISIGTSPTRDFAVSVKKVGKVSSALHKLNPGDVIGVRGPYGRGFPLEELKGNDLLLIGGGIGLPPLRSLLEYAIDNKESFGKLHLLYGARTPNDLVYRNLFPKWRKHFDIYLTVDYADETWLEYEGVVTSLFPKICMRPEKTYAVIVGPPIMIKYSVLGLLEDGFNEDKIIISLERMMKCGLGTCGHCNIGKYYVCKDGPVFKYSQVKDIPELF